MRWIARLGIAVLFLAGTVGGDSVMAVEAPDYQASGHAFLLTIASGDAAVAVPDAEDIPSSSLCGYEWVFTQSIHFMTSPCPYRGGCASPLRLELTTAPIPPGPHTLTVVEYCPPFNIYRVDFSTRS